MRSGNLVFICPHWHQHGNVGLLRAKRMVRWLHDSDYHVSILCAGSYTRIESTDFGKLITIKDPLGIYAESDPASIPTASKRKPNALRRLLSYLIFCPDLQIAWAYNCRFNSQVREACEIADVILSSSPPESAHVLAGWMAAISDNPFIMDMRDGWLDEPMKPLLKSSFLQRLREARLESRLVRQASRIVVSSEVWSKMLVNRYPELQSKVTVLTNAYAVSGHSEGAEYHNKATETHTGFEISDSEHYNSSYPVSAPSSSVTLKTGEDNPLPGKVLHFLHAGRIQSSRPERKVEHILSPLLDIAHMGKISGKITFVGNLTDEEEVEISQWSNRFNSCNWEIMRVAQVTHAQSRELMTGADVLLMLSPSKASIPAKFFDYVSVGKPFLCITDVNSAVHEISSDIPQCFHINVDRAETLALAGFLNECTHGMISVEIPKRFEDGVVKTQFLDLLSEVVNQ